MCYDKTSVISEQDNLILHQKKLISKREAISSILRHLSLEQTRTRRGEKRVLELEKKFKEARKEINRQIYNIDMEIQAFNGTLAFQGDL